MDVHENAWDAHCDYHNAKNEHLLQVKIDRLQAAGDGLAEIARDFVLTMKDNARLAMLQTTVDRLERYIAEVEAKLADWNSAKEMR